MALNLGIRLRTEKVKFFNPNLVLGHEMTWGAAGSVKLPFLARAEPRALAEIAGAYGGDDGPSPSEVRGGLRARAIADVLFGERAWRPPTRFRCQGVAVGCFQQSGGCAI
jgi:hypothetical protein